MNLELLLVFSVEAGTAGNPAMFTTPQRKDVIYFRENGLCYNCGHEGHGANHCRSRPCFKCKSGYHTSLYDKPSVNGPTQVN